VKPQPSDIEPLNSWSDRQFGDWIRASLHDYFIGRRGRFAFEPLQTFFGEDYDVTEEVMDVFSLLTEHARTRFRSGLSIALAETELSAELVIDSLLNLARRTLATHVLRVFADTLLHNWQQHKAEVPELDHAILWTVGVLARFAGDSSLTGESVACLETLARFEKMPKAYVLPFFKLLCESRPTDLVENLKSFWSLLDKNFGSTHGGHSAREQGVIQERLVREVLEICGREAVLPTITTTIRQSGDQSIYSYTWWQQASVNLLLKLSVPLPEEKQEEEPTGAITSVSIVPEKPSSVPGLTGTTGWLAHLRENFPEAIEVLKSLEPA